MDERALGANIRRLRQAAQQTVTALAKRAGLTKSTVSKIETGQVSTPISTLMRLADALDLPLAEFFLEAQEDPPFVYTRKGQGKVITRDGTRFGYSYEALALAMRHKRAEPFLLTIGPRDPVGTFQHGGQEFVYMLSGSVEFTVGSQTLRLSPGDSLYFDPTLVHKTRILSKAPARFLCLFIQNPGGRAVAKTQRSHA